MHYQSRAHWMVHADPYCMHAHMLNLLTTTHFTIKVFVWYYEASVTCFYASIPQGHYLVKQCFSSAPAFVFATTLYWPLTII